MDIDLISNILKVVLFVLIIGIIRRSARKGTYNKKGELVLEIKVLKIVAIIYTVIILLILKDDFPQTPQDTLLALLLLSAGGLLFWLSWGKTSLVGNQIKSKTIFSSDINKEIFEIKEIYPDILDNLVIEFQDRTKIRVFYYQSGFSEFMRRILDQLPEYKWERAKKYLKQHL